MPTPTDIAITAAEAVTYSDGTPGFAWIKPYAEVPGDFPAFFLVRRVTDGVVHTRRGAPVTATSTLEAVMYHPTDALDLETETRTEFGPEAIESLFGAYVYELIREAPTDPETGETAEMPRAPTTEVSNVQRGSRSVDGDRMYTLGFSMSLSGGAPDPKPLS